MSVGPHTGGGEPERWGLGPGLQREWEHQRCVRGEGIQSLPTGVSGRTCVTSRTSFLSFGPYFLPGKEGGWEVKSLHQLCLMHSTSYPQLLEQSREEAGVFENKSQTSSHITHRHVHVYCQWVELDLLCFPYPQCHYPFHSGSFLLSNSGA